MQFRISQIETFPQCAEFVFDVRCPESRRNPCARKTQQGFTLVELIMTIVIVGIVAATVAPRFFDNNVFQSRGFTDQVQASLRYAQKEAIAQRRFVCSTFSGNSITLSIGTTATCGTPLVSPTGQASYVVNAPAGVAFASAPVNFSFNSQGIPSVAQTINIVGATNSITIEAETGYVH